MFRACGAPKHLYFAPAARRSSQIQSKDGLSREIKILYGRGWGVVGEVDSHYDYRHRIYSLHMSYGFSTGVAVAHSLTSDPILGLWLGEI